MAQPVLRVHSILSAAHVTELTPAGRGATRTPSGSAGGAPSSLEAAALGEESSLHRPPLERA